MGSVVDRIRVCSFTVPTDGVECDGTLCWDATTVVVAQVGCDGVEGLGFTYATGACVTLVDDILGPVVLGRDPTDVPAAWRAMVGAIRNLGRPGICSMAIAAMDTALWDLAARLIGTPLVTLLGRARDDVPIYGSGGFTSYDDDRLVEQLAGWVQAGIPRVKMKIGTSHGSAEARDVERVASVRDAIGPDAALLVDANGGYDRKQAVRLGRQFVECGVTWFEEPVSSDDLDGLRVVRDQCDIDVAAGEYGYAVPYFAAMCRAGAVDVLQADVSRCAGYTEWRRVAAVAAAHGLEISGHCAPALHLPVAAAVPNLRHVEWFHDHVRADGVLFDGVPRPDGGVLHPYVSGPGHGMTLRPDAPPPDAAPVERRLGGARARVRSDGRSHGGSHGRSHGRPHGRSHQEES